jgi:hypothetical protein
MKFVFALLFLLESFSIANVDWVNVADSNFGANGSDNNSDDAAFASALSYSVIRKSQSSGIVSATLYIPAGRYKLSQTIVFPKWLNVIGDGASSVLLDFSTLPSNDTAIFWGSYVDNDFPGEPVSISGFSIAGPNSSVQETSNTIGIYVGEVGQDSLRKLNLAKMSNVEISNFDYGIYLGGHNYMNKFEHMYVRENKYGLFKPWYNGGDYDNGENIAFDHVVFGRNWQHIKIRPGEGGGYDLRFTGCSFDYGKAPSNLAESEIGLASMVVFDACHWETDRVGTANNPLLLRISDPMANLLFINNNFIHKFGNNTGSPIMWAPETTNSWSDMNINFINCNVHGFSSINFYNSRSADIATQPIALAISSPRINGSTGKITKLSPKSLSAIPKISVIQGGNSTIDGIYIERSGDAKGVYLQMQADAKDSFKIRYNYNGSDTERLAINRDGEIKLSGTVKFPNINTGGSGTKYFACIDSFGTLFKQNGPCN